MPHLQHTLKVRKLRVALWWQVWQETCKCTTFVSANVALSVLQSGTLWVVNVAPLGMFHPMEQVVPPHGTNCSTPWNFLRSAIWLFVHRHL